MKLPAGFDGSLSSQGAALHVVVIQGRPEHEVPGEAGARALEPGSYFGSGARVAHRVACDPVEACILYVRTEGEFDVVPAQRGK